MGSQLARFRAHLRRLFQGLLLKLHRHTIAFSFAVVLLVVTLMVFSLYEVEPAQDSAIWRAFVYLLSGIDIDPPETIEGRFASVILMLCGIMLVSLLTGFVAAEFARVLSLAQFIPRKPEQEQFRDHVVLFGWNEKVRNILSQLNSVYSRLGLAARKIIIVAEEQNLERLDEPIYDHVWHVHGPAAEETVLKKAGLWSAEDGKGGARLAAIISDPALSAAEADRKTLLNILAVEHLNPSVVSVAEARIEENVEHFGNAYVDQCLMPDQYANMLLARTTAFPGTASYLDYLLSLGTLKSGGSGAIRLLKPQTLNAVGDRLDRLISKRYRETRGLVVGLIRAGELTLYPNINTNEQQIEADDLLIEIEAQA